MDDPFVARVEVDWTEDGRGRQTFYLARGSACGLSTAIPGACFITSLSALASLAEYDPGETAEFDVNGKQRKALIRHKAVLSAKYSDASWDALMSTFAVAGRPTVPDIAYAASLRSALAALRADLERSGVPEDDIADLLREIAEAEASHGASRRKVLDRIALRDQPILDRYQGAVFRLPLNSQLMLFGPPGFGKTTTLIKRLAQKRTADALSDDENRLISVYSRERFMDQSGWAMFSPTELLKAYLSRAFNREGVPDNRNVRTWDKERLFLARDVLSILRSGNSGRYQMDPDLSVLADEASSTQIRLHDEFSDFVDRTLSERILDALTALAPAEGALGLQISSIRSSLDGTGSRSIDEILASIDARADLRPEMKAIDERVDAETQEILKEMLRRSPQTLNDIIAKLPELRSDGDENDDDDTDDDQPTPSRADPRMEALDLLTKAIRDHARASVSRRSAGGRSGRVSEIVGSRLPERARFAALGADMLLRSRVRALVMAPRASVMGLPALYARFRRQAIRSGSGSYGTDRRGMEIVRRNVISPAETDVLILVSLRNARRIVQRARSSRSDTAPAVEWLARIERNYLAQVFVDEATDLSAVQLACTIELSDPSLRSWFAAGDPRQRITLHGLAGPREIEWINRVTGARVGIERIDVGYRQSSHLRDASVALSALFDDADDRGTRPPTGESASTVRPILAEGINGEALVQWLADRILEIVRNTGSIPAIAVFVEDNGQIAGLAAALGARLRPFNIPVAGYQDGLTMGDALEVRVFDIRHVKGMEFEAVFFLDSDLMAQRLPGLFLRLMYVGMTRAATYLGVTCAHGLPRSLIPIREHFQGEKW